jgi:hypothetical protein
MSLKGIDRANRPLFWQPYEKSVPDVLAKSRSISVLLTQYSARASELRAELARIKADEATARFLPLRARVDWVIVVNAAGAVIGPLRADGFF